MAALQPDRLVAPCDRKPRKSSFLPSPRMAIDSCLSTQSHPPNRVGIETVRLSIILTSMDLPEGQVPLEETKTINTQRASQDTVQGIFAGHTA